MNKSTLAAIMAVEWPHDYHELRDALPQWVLFFTIAGYDYLPEERVAYQIKDMEDLAQRLGVEPAKVHRGNLGGRIAEKSATTSEEPYWKLRSKGACEDIFFLTTYGRVPGLVAEMYDAAAKAGYPSPELGIYLQPIVQGTNCHCEFTLLYDSHEDPREVEARSGVVH